VVRFPAAAADFSLQSAQTGSGPNLPCLTGTKALSPTNWQTHEANHSPPSSSGVKNQWYYHQSAICLPVLHRDKFTFIFTFPLDDDE